VRISTRNVVAQYRLVEGMHEVMTVREKQKLVRLVSIRVRFEVLVGANIQCDVYVISPISRSLYVKRGNPILDLRNNVLVG
jgi:hypothetical protein